MTPEQWVDWILEIHPDLYSQPEFAFLSREREIELIKECNVPEDAISKNLCITISEFGIVSFIDMNTRIQYLKNNVTIQHPIDFCPWYKYAK